MEKYSLPIPYPKTSAEKSTSFKAAVASLCLLRELVGEDVDVAQRLSDILEVSDITTDDLDALLGECMVSVAVKHAIIDINTAREELASRDAG